MEKSLHTIQVFAKIGKIFSQIVFIFCLVGAALVLICGVLLGLGADLMEMNIVDIFEDGSGFSLNDLWVVFLVSFVTIAGEAVVAKFAANYFKHELAAGTPFSVEGAREMRRLGILAIAIPLAAAIICYILTVVLQFSYDDIPNYLINGGVSLGTGLSFIAVSYICQYGAEREMI